MTTSAATDSGTAPVSCAGVPTSHQGNVRLSRFRLHLPVSAVRPGSARLEEMPREPVRVAVEGDGDARYVVLTYANGDIVRRRVDPDQKPRRRPRRPPTRIKPVRARSAGEV